MSRFYEIIDHASLDDETRKLVGMKGGKICHYTASNSTRLLLTDKREVVVPDAALRQLLKR